MIAGGQPLAANIYPSLDWRLRLAFFLGVEQREKVRRFEPSEFFGLSSVSFRSLTYLPSTRPSPNTGYICQASVCSCSPLAQSWSCRIIVVRFFSEQPLW